MGALPKRKISKARKGRRRSGIELNTVNVSKCPQCGHAKKSHVACPNCGYYRK